jgi:glyoxylase-like metal-dependent hydrolase (beta-lactamase superfamily II)
MRLSIVLLAGAAMATLGPAASRPAPSYEVSAIRFGTIDSYPIRSLVAGGDRTRNTALVMTVWLIRGDGRNVLVDAGFYRDRLVQRWRPSVFMKPSEAVAAAGVPADQVTDIIVSHVHWDHMDGLDLFPKARVWIQREEYEYYVSADGKPAHSGIEAEDAAMLAQIKAAGRVMLVDGDAKEIMPGITVYTGGKHTFASQFAGVNTRVGTVVLASDNMYLYENLDKRAAIAQTLDAMSNLAAQDRMRTLVANPKYIVPGHDPLVFERFPLPGKGVARIDVP